jgi:hypothetical protein
VCVTELVTGPRAAEVVPAAPSPSRSVIAASPSKLRGGTSHRATPLDTMSTCVSVPAPNAHMCDVPAPYVSAVPAKWSPTSVRTVPPTVGLCRGWCARSEGGATNCSSATKTSRAPTTPTPRGPTPCAKDEETSEISAMPAARAGSAQETPSATARAGTTAPSTWHASASTSASASPPRASR